MPGARRAQRRNCPDFPENAELLAYFQESCAGWEPVALGWRCPSFMLTAAGCILLQFPRLGWNGALPGFCVYPMTNGPQVLGFGMPDLGGCYTQLPSSNFLSRVMLWHPKGGLAAPASKQHRHCQNPQLPLGWGRQNSWPGQNLLQGCWGMEAQVCARRDSACLHCSTAILIWHPKHPVCSFFRVVGASLCSQNILFK